MCLTYKYIPLHVHIIVDSLYSLLEEQAYNGNQYDETIDKVDGENAYQSLTDIV